MEAARIDGGQSQALTYWTRSGIGITAARSLVERKLFTVEDLKGLRREELLALRHVGERKLARIEMILGRKLPRGHRDYWRRRGLNPLIAGALCRAGIRSAKGLAGMTREELLSLRGVGRGALRQCEALLGHPLPSALNHWLAQGLTLWVARQLSSSRILTFQDLGRLSPDQIRHLGFTPAETERLVKLGRRGAVEAAVPPGRPPFKRGS